MRGRVGTQELQYPQVRYLEQHSGTISGEGEPPATAAVQAFIANSVRIRAEVRHTLGGVRHSVRLWADVRQTLRG